MRLYKYRHLLIPSSTSTVLTINQARRVIQKHLASLKSPKPEPETKKVELSLMAINRAKELLPLLNNQIGSSHFKNVAQVIEHAINKEWSRFQTCDASFNRSLETEETQAQA
jgi:hypothetical protein